MTTATAPAQLTATDRCDRCGAQAFVLVRLHSGLDLQFCAHHYAQHASALQPLADQVIDDTRRLLQP
jgi:hypothetical protein